MILAREASGVEGGGRGLLVGSGVAPCDKNVTCFAAHTGS